MEEEKEKNENPICTEKKYKRSWGTLLLGEISLGGEKNPSLPPLLPNFTRAPGGDEHKRESSKHAKPGRVSSRANSRPQPLKQNLEEEGGVSPCCQPTKSTGVSKGDGETQNGK